MFYNLKEDFNGFKKGIVVLEGGLDPEVEYEGLEYFDITTEMTTGHSYSNYGIPKEILAPIEGKKQKEVESLFNSFVFNNYKLNNNILKYSKV